MTDRRQTVRKNKSKCNDSISKLSKLVEYIFFRIKEAFGSSWILFAEKHKTLPLTDQEKHKIKQIHNLEPRDQN